MRRPVTETIRGASLLAALALAACGQSPGVAETGAAKSHFAGAPLWDDPQNTPHAAFNWPTLSSPPPGPQLPDWWSPPPARPLPAQIAGLEHVAQGETVGRGAGIAVFGSLVVVPGFGAPSSIVAIADPERPRVLSRFNKDENLSHRGAAIIAYPEGRLVTVISTDSVIDVWEITDPFEPRRLTTLPTRASHKLGVVPGTPIVYNAASQGGEGLEGNVGQGTGVTEIYDLSDPARPVHVGDFENGHSCHHIFFWNNPAQNRHRAVCAGVEFTQIWDTADPRKPSVIVSLPVHLGVPGTPSVAVVPLAFSHTAGLNRAGTVLYVGDEAGGGGLPPGCVASVSTPAGAASAPVGAVWFYDITTETAPRLAGWYSASIDPAVASGSCTVHHGRLVPDPEGRDLLAIAAYAAGVTVIDFTNPALPAVVDRFAEGSYTWESWYHNGYVITGDLSRGLDVLGFR